MKKEDKRSKEYLKGYKEGFLAALTMAWALAEDLLITVDNPNKPDVQAYIDKITS